MGHARDDGQEDSRIRVLVVDDHPAVLNCILQALPLEFDVVAALDSAAALAGVVERYAPDIIMLDITMPAVNGIAAATQLTRAGCPARIVFLTVHADPDYVRAALAAGACGYVVKSRLAQDLVPALHAAAAGRRFVSPLAMPAAD